MSTTASREAQIQQRVQAIMASLREPVDYKAQLEQLHCEVKAYEERFGLPSERIHEAIEAGELVEDLDVGHWIFKVTLLNSLEEE